MDEHHKVPEEKSGEAGAEQGVVILDGPDGVAVAMTPDAADATATALAAAARIARQQSDKDG